MRHQEFSSLFIEKGSCCLKCFDQMSMDLTFITKTRFLDYADLVFRLRKFLNRNYCAGVFLYICFLTLYINNNVQKIQYLSNDFSVL